MKKLTTLGLAAALLLMSVAFAPQSARAQGPGLVSSIINKMERNRRDLRSLRSGLVMQKYNAQVDAMDMYSGAVQYVPGAGRNVSLRIDWEKPQRETLTVENGKYTLFRPRMNLAYVGSTNSKNAKVSGVLGFSLNASGAQLRNNYNFEVVGEGILYDGGPHVTMLKVYPKSAASFKYAEIWVDGGGMPVQTRVTERNGDSTLVRLVSIQRNARISSDVFRQQLGSDVKIVKG